MRDDPSAGLRFDPPPSRMSREAFVARFGGVYEHSPWVAEAVWDAGLTPADDVAGVMADVMAGVVARSGRPAQLALIRAHPDLAGRVALTDASRTEQEGAGLDRCTPEEYERFKELNAAYKRRFGFPFIIAVAGLSRQDILAAFAARLANGPETEFKEALHQIHRIARNRLIAQANRP